MNNFLALSVAEQSAIKKIIINAIREDVGDGDHTSLACIPPNSKSKAKLLVKENGIIAGVEIANLVAKEIDKNLKIKNFITDGTSVKIGDIVFEISGKAQSILKAERLMLNIMQRMSGIATKTNQLIKLCKGTKVQILDTRKTTPGIRLLEKIAVKIGGGNNHRFGLFDMILIKDNHIDYAGSIENAINSANNYLKEKKKKLKIEIETRNLNELKEVLKIGKINRIMLDNFSPADIKKALQLINSKYETEASGGITENNLREYALTGVNFISIGALTHSVKSLDLSLKAI